MTDEQDKKTGDEAGSGTDDRRGPTRRALLAGAASGLVLGAAQPLWAFGETSRLTVGLVQHGGNWNPRPNGVRKVLQEVEKRTSIAIDPVSRGVSPSARERLFEHPLLVWAGDGEFPPLNARERENLSLFVRAGGLILADSAEAQLGGGFERSIRREIDAIVPGRPFQEIPRSHVLYKSFYLVPEAVGRVSVSRKMDAVFGEDRALVLLSHNDLLGAWSRDNFGQYEYDVFPGGERQREMSYRLGINIVMYAMCLNYKEDQVHVPFILKRRKWKVD